MEYDDKDSSPADLSEDESLPTCELGALTNMPTEYHPDSLHNESLAYILSVKDEAVHLPLPSCKTQPVTPKPSNKPIASWVQTLVTLDTTDPSQNKADQAIQPSSKWIQNVLFTFSELQRSQNSLNGNHQSNTVTSSNLLHASHSAIHELNRIQFYASADLTVNNSQITEKAPDSFFPISLNDWILFLRSHPYEDAYSNTLDSIKSTYLLKAYADQWETDSIEKQKLTENPHYFFLNETDTLWIFAALVNLDTLHAMDANVASNLQKLRRHCEYQNDALVPESTPTMQKALMLLIVIIRKCFKQI